MTKAERKAWINTFYEEVFNGQNAAAAGKYLAENYIQHNPGVAQGRQGFIDTFTEAFKKGFGHLEIQHIICDDDYICVHLFSRNRETGQIGSWVSDIYRVENDLLAEHWDCIQKLKV